jgi:hypothetical protein
MLRVVVSAMPVLSSRFEKGIAHVQVFRGVTAMLLAIALLVVSVILGLLYLKGRKQALHRHDAGL